MSEGVLQFLKRISGLQTKPNSNRLRLLQISEGQGRILDYAHTKSETVEEITVFTVTEDMRDELLALRFIMPSTQEGEYIVNDFAIARLALSND